MEYKDNKEYQFVEGIIASLEDQLNNIEAFENKKRGINEHFELCMNALFERRNILLNQLSLLYEQQGICTDKKDEIPKRIKDCKEILNAGCNLYQYQANVAEHIWQAARKIQLPYESQSKFQVEIDLPRSFLEVIRSYGSAKPILVVQNSANIRDASSLFISEKNLQTLENDKDNINFAGSPSSSSSSSSSKTSTSSTSDSFASSSLSNNEPIEKFTHVHMVTTFAGSGVYGHKDGNGRQAQFSSPAGICFNPNDGCFYISEADGCVRRLTMQGDVTTFAQAPKEIWGVAFYAKENALFGVGGRAVYKFSAGNSTVYYQDKAILMVKFQDLTGLAIDQHTGSIYVTDNARNRIWKINSAREATLLAGSGHEGYKDGKGSNAQFNFPLGICWHATIPALLLCDSGNHKIRQISLDGNVTTLCDAKSPTCIVTTSDGRYLVTSLVENTILQVTTQGTQTTVKEIAGSGEWWETKDGKANECSFMGLWSIAVHEPSNSCFVTEFNGNVVRRISFL